MSFERRVVSVEIKAVQLAPENLDLVSRVTEGELQVLHDCEGEPAGLESIFDDRAYLLGDWLVWLNDRIYFAITPDEYKRMIAESEDLLIGQVLAGLRAEDKR